MATTTQSFSVPSNPRQATWSVPGAPAAPTLASGAVPSPNFFGRTPEAAAVINPINLPRIPGADPLIQGQFGDSETLRKLLSADANTYREAISGLTPAVMEQTEQQLSALNQLYNGQFSNQLAAIRARRAQALSGLQDQLFADLRRGLSLGVTGGQGVAGAGLSSYLTNVAARESGRLRAAEAYDAAEAERTDAGAVLAAQMAALGRPQQLTDATAARLLLPAQFDVTANAAVQSAVERALQQALANTLSAYGMQV